MTHIIIAPDSFKESLSAIEVGASLKKGMESSPFKFTYDVVPVADGGEGFTEAMVSGLQGYKKNFRVHDALMRPIEASIGFSMDGTIAFIEMASASGIEHIAPKDRNPLITSTYGTGELIMHAARCGCKQIIMGIGGSATNDGGAGMAKALGVGLYDLNGKEIELGGENLLNLATIDTSKMLQNIPEIIVACDVSNPLTGTLGASEIYGPQKGATPDMVLHLDNNLKHLAQIIRMQLNRDIENIPGAGAAGGLGAGLMAFLNARLKNGFQLVSETLQLEERIKASDWVITAEGRLDHQTIHGKAPFGVASIAKQYKKPVIGVAGTLSKNYTALYEHGFDILLSIINAPIQLSDAIKNAKSLLELTGLQIGHIIGLTQKSVK